MKGKIFGALAIAAVAVIATGPVQAGCSPASKEFSLGYGDSGNFDLVFPASANSDISTAVIGHIWQPGAFATTGDLSGGGCNDTLWLYPPSGAGTMTIYGSNGSDLGNGVCDTQVCPAGGEIVVVQTTSTDGKNAFFAAGRVAETPQPAFDYARTQSDWAMVPIPRPKVTVPTPSGSGSVSINVTLDPPASAFHAPAADAQQATATISGYQLVSFTGLADPGRAAGLWTNIPSGNIATTAPAGNGIVVPCPLGQHVFIANRPVFDGGQLSGDYVSASTDINCSNLANPGSPRIKPIGKKKIAGM
jgi:hypothetical protein